MAQKRSVTRRSVIAGAGLAASSAWVNAKETPIWSNEYTAHKTGKSGDVSLNLFRKRMGAPKAGEALPVLFLVHGSSISSRNSFDLTVPGMAARGEYSVMNTFARWGFDVWTMDHENYGRSSRTQGNSDIASGVADLEAGVDLVVRETGQQKVHLCGESSGALRAGAYAMVRPERAKQLDAYRAHNLRLRDRAMIRSIFTRDKPGTSDPAIAEYLADQELKFGDQVPTGTYLDMTANLPVVDPAKVLAPVLLVRGEYDGIATVEDLEEFYKRLPNGDRQFIILPGMAHSVVLGLNRRIFWHVMHAFLTMPAVEKEAVS